MKSVLISIQPKWCKLIASGKKTIEVRKTFPKVKEPFKCYIYCTANKQGTKDLLEIHGTDGKIRKANGKVIGEFVCDTMTRAVLGNYCILPKSQTCIDELDLLDYADEKTIYGWHISNLVIYDKPRDLSEFWKLGKCPYAYGMLCTYEGHCYRAGQTIRCGEIFTRPPQSWCYVESEVEGE